MKRKPHLDSRIEKCAFLMVKQPAELRGRWLGESGCHELRLELGCGKGRFTVEAAKAEPDVLFAAFEKTQNVIVTAMERAAAEGLKNVVFASLYVNDLTEYFARCELSRIYLNFPDPWPSNKYARRRLTAANYLEQYSLVLRPGGEVHFKTDNLPFYEYSLGQFELSGFEIIEDIRDLHKNGPVGIFTDYEEKFHNQGFPVYRCVISKD